MAITIEQRFAHVSDTDKRAAVAGFVQVNPHYNGIDFYTMMEMILDADAHLGIIGDVVVEGAKASELVQHFITLKVLGFGPPDWDKAEDD